MNGEDDFISKLVGSGGESRPAEGAGAFQMPFFSHFVRAAGYVSPAAFGAGAAYGLGRTIGRKLAYRPARLDTTPAKNRSFQREREIKTRMEAEQARERNRRSLTRGLDSAPFGGFHSFLGNIVRSMESLSPRDFMTFARTVSPAAFISTSAARAVGRSSVEAAKTIDRQIGKAQQTLSDVASAAKTAVLTAGIGAAGAASSVASSLKSTITGAAENLKSGITNTVEAAGDAARKITAVPTTLLDKLGEGARTLTGKIEGAAKGFAFWSAGTIALVAVIAVAALFIFSKPQTIAKSVRLLKVK